MALPYRPTPESPATAESRAKNILLYREIMSEALQIVLDDNNERIGFILHYEGKEAIRTQEADDYLREVHDWVYNWVYTLLSDARCYMRNQALAILTKSQGGQPNATGFAQWNVVCMMKTLHENAFTPQAAQGLSKEIQALVRAVKDLYIEFIRGETVKSQLSPEEKDESMLRLQGERGPQGLTAQKFKNDLLMILAPQTAARQDDSRGRQGFAGAESSTRARSNPPQNRSSSQSRTIGISAVGRSLSPRGRNQAHPFLVNLSEPKYSQSLQKIQESLRAKGWRVVRQS